MPTIDIPDAIFSIQVEAEHHDGDRRWEERGWNVYVMVGEEIVFHRFYFNEYDLDWHSKQPHAIDDEQAKRECLTEFAKRLRGLLA